MPRLTGEADFLRRTGGAENPAARFTSDGDDDGEDYDDGGDDDGRHQPILPSREPVKG